ncbi:MAG: pyruvate kinase [Clostridiales bacterium]|nr:pyruvate kinase [Clostridiales bacterium]
MRKTKIVCTIGPASESREVIMGLCKAGMNVARLNFSHSTHEEHKQRIEYIKSVREELKLPIAIMLDTKGPEYRIKTFENGKVELKEGDEFTFTTNEVVGTNKIVSVTYNELHKELSVGDTILLNDGLLSLKVEKIENNDIKCKVIIGGSVSDRKSMSFPDKVLHQKYLSDQDKSDIKFGVENGVDYIACSFVSTAQDLIDVKNYLKELKAEDIELIAKIENQSGVDNIEEIAKYCDGIMVARGDMGVEIPFECLPAIQKQLISKCIMLGKRVITATEMLESMITKPRPTRAEISDVANAVYDGTSAIMLSGETAAGKYPIQTVKTMAKIAETAENNIDYEKLFYKTEFSISNTMDAISHSTCGMAIDVHAKAVAVCSLSGTTARMISRFRPPVPIVGLTTNEKTWRKLALSWGVMPEICETFTSTDVLFYMAKNTVKDVLSLKKGDKLVITGGTTPGKSGTTNIIKIEEI